MPFAMFGGSTTCTASAPCLNIHPGNVDSYNSHKATCSSPTAGGICLQSTTNTGNNGSIASNGNITVQGAVHGNVIGNADVAGDPSDVGGTGHVYGYIKSGGQVVYTDPVDGGITQNQTTPQTPLPAEPNCGPPFTVLNTAPGGNVTLSGPGSYSYTQSTGQLSISSGKIVTLQPGTYCFGHVSVQNNGTQLAVSGPGVTAIFVDGVFEAKSGAQLNNSTQDPQSLQIISTYGNEAGETGTGVLLDAGGTTMYMTVYAPTTKVLFQGGGNLYGAIVGQTVEYTGGSACPSMPCSTGVHFDEYLASGQANLIRGIPVPSTVTTTTTTTVTSTIYSYSYGSYSVVSWLQSNCRKTSSWLCS